MMGGFMGMLLYSQSIPTALLSLYVLYWFLPPSINIVGTSIGFLSGLGFAEFIYFVYFYISRLTKGYDRTLMNKSIRYVVSLVAFYLLIAIMSKEMPLEEQLDSIKHFIYYSFNIILAASCLNRKREFVCIFHFVILLIIISGIYGIYTYIIQYNPVAEYVLLTQDQLEGQGLGSDFLEDERGFLQGRISGFTAHPLVYGGILVLCFFLLMSYFRNIKNKWGRLFMYLLFSFCLLLMVLTGSRSILIGLIVGLFYYLFKLYPQKVVRYSLLGFVLIMMFGVTIEDDYIRSVLFFWEENDEIKGSSLSMRIDQIGAAFDVISKDIDSFLFGLGRGWTTQYGLKYGNIPPFHGFEGLFIFSLVEFGVLGTIIYILVLFVQIYKFNMNIVDNTQMKLLINVFLFSGFIIFVFTGHAYGQWLYLVFAFMMMRYGSIINESNYYKKG